MQIPSSKFQYHLTLKYELTRANSILDVKPWVISAHPPPQNCVKKLQMPCLEIQSKSTPGALQVETTLLYFHKNHDCHYYCDNSQISHIYIKTKALAPNVPRASRMPWHLRNCVIKSGNVLLLEKRVSNLNCCLSVLQREGK